MVTSIELSKIKTNVLINSTAINLLDPDSIQKYLTTAAIRDKFMSDYSAVLLDICAGIVLSCESIGIGLVCKSIDFNITIPETSNMLLPKELQIENEKFPILEICFNPDKENNPFLSTFGYKLILVSKARANNNINNVILYTWHMLISHIFTLNIQQITGLSAQYSFMQWIERALCLDSEKQSSTKIIENANLTYTVAKYYWSFIGSMQQHFMLVQNILQEQEKIKTKNKIIRA